MAYKSKKNKMKGSGVMDFLKGVNEKLKSGKYISRGLKTLGTAGNIPIIGSYIAPYQSSLLKAGQVVDTLGYGKKKRSKKMK